MGGLQSPDRIAAAGVWEASNRLIGSLWSVGRGKMIIRTLVKQMEQYIVYRKPRLQSIQGLDLYSIFDLSRLDTICRTACRIGLTIEAAEDLSGDFCIRLYDPPFYGVLASVEESRPYTRREIMCLCDSLDEKEEEHAESTFDALCDSIFRERLIWRIMTSRYTVGGISRICALRSHADEICDRLVRETMPVLAHELSQAIDLPNAVCGVIFSYLHMRADFYEHRRNIALRIIKWKMVSLTECNADGNTALVYRY